jgi:formamidopyrimidine-DNA glycosylase
LPELPEVETIVRDLRPQLEGRVVRSAVVAEPGVLRYPDPATFRRRITGRRLEKVGRHGKFMLVELDDARREKGSDPGPEFLMIHLGMTGRLGLAEPESELPPHTHLRLHLSSGAELRMQDYRRFGRVLLGSATELAGRRALPALGPEPATDSEPNPESWQGVGGRLSEGAFGAMLERSRRPIKALLLDQGAVAGLGNIYCDEACFRAGIRPTAPANSLSPARRRRLFRGIHEVLASAVEFRGTSVDDYRDGFGEPGQNQHRLLVYGRAGQPCVRCGRLLRNATVAGRTTVYCWSCQR